MRIVVLGISGAGKTTLARELASRLALPHIELDAINWQPGWHDLIRHDLPEFRRRVAEAVTVDGWVVDGDYKRTRDLVWPRATHVIWLDYQRPVIMRRVIGRSLLRALCRTELWAGNRERWTHWLSPGHPIRFAWSAWEQRRHETEAALDDDEYTGLVVLRLRHPREARQAVSQLIDAAQGA